MPLRNLNPYADAVLSFHFQNIFMDIPCILSGYLFISRIKHCLGKRPFGRRFHGLSMQICEKLE